jgi:hypothetical protein
MGVDRVLRHRHLDEHDADLGGRQLIDHTTQ